jgi:hypothetical protein
LGHGAGVVGTRKEHRWIRVGQGMIYILSIDLVIDLCFSFVYG